MSQPTRQRGFSLMELMIAIMILGIGTVMVATVFPIGIDIARQAIQANLAPAVLQSAATTLRVKVPAYGEFDGIIPPPLNPTDGTHRVLVPDTYKIELKPGSACSIDEYGMEVLNLLFPPPPSSPPYPAQVYNTWGPEWAGPYNLEIMLTTDQTVPDFVSLTRVFTERTGWANEYNIANPANEAYLVPAQNLPVNWLDPALTDDKIIVTMPCQSFGASPPMLQYLPRIHLADQVYPPVEVRDADGNELTVGQIAEFVASRRYSWIAFHHRMSSSSSERQDMLATVVVFHRADLAERYARQVDLDTGTPGYQAAYDLSVTEHQEALLQPQPDVAIDVDGVSLDTLFPQPWLVALGRVNPATGEVGCTGEVARLLPAGTFFVVARSVDGMPAGRYFEVLESSWDTDNLEAGDPWDDTAWATLTIPRGTGEATDGVVVWVFPPAIDRAAGTFGRRSPIAGVGMEVLTFSDD